MLTNKKQENLVLVHAEKIMKPISFRINRKKYGTRYGNGSVNSEEQIKNQARRLFNIYAYIHPFI